MFDDNGRDRKYNKFVKHRKTYWNKIGFLFTFFEEYAIITKNLSFCNKCIHETENFVAFLNKERIVSP